MEGDREQISDRSDQLRPAKTECGCTRCTVKVCGKYRPVLVRRAQFMDMVLSTPCEEGCPAEVSDVLVRLTRLS